MDIREKIRNHRTQKKEETEIKAKEAIKLDLTSNFIPAGTLGAFDPKNKSNIETIKTVTRNSF